jgi:invasion protein IalB
MVLRIATSLLMLFAATCVAEAERRLPAEKYSPRPVQSAPKYESADRGTIVYSPWTKFCGKDSQNPQAESVCFTVKEARLETGQFIAGAALMEQTGDEKKRLRFSLPLGIRLMPGARVFIDGEAMRTVPPLQCLPNICVTGFEVTADFIGKLKRGDQLKLEGIDVPGMVATWPLAEFSRTFDGPPTDPKRFEEDQKRQVPGLRQ